MADRVTITFNADVHAPGVSFTAGNKYVKFTVSDYEEALATGEIGRYLTERVYPVLARDWLPCFRETGRKVERISSVTDYPGTAGGPT